MSDEALVTEIRKTVARLKVTAATWEWAIWKSAAVPKLHFLKITFHPWERPQSREAIFDIPSLSVWRAETSVSEVDRLLDHCLAVRPLLERMDATRLNEIQFQLGPHTVEIIGNFPGSKIDFYGSAVAKDHWLLKADTPFFLADYALHSSVSVDIQRHHTFYETDPPFANIGELYKHYFGVDVGNRTGPWLGIVIPVHMAQVDTLTIANTSVTVTIRLASPLVGELFLSVVCRAEDGADFRRRCLVSQEQIEFNLEFKPASVDVALYHRDLLIDLVEWRPPRSTPDRTAVVAEGVFAEGEAVSQSRLARVRYHYRLLKAQLETYDQAKAEKWGVVRGNLYRIFRDTLSAASAELPGLLPTFSEEQFREGSDDLGNLYNAMAIRTHLRMALAALEGDLELATGIERRHMELAVEEARKCSSEDSRPRPKVGVVVVKDGVVLAAAHRGQLGQGEHAEFTALEKILEEQSIAGAVVYTTLEPCTTRNHPKVPCVQRLIERKVARVVIGMLDPDPRISGRGVVGLRDANIGVDLFPDDLKSQIEELNREFRRHADARRTEPQVDRTRAALRVELPPPINRIGGMSAGAAYTPSWNVRVRIIAQEPVDVVEVHVVEEGVGPWRLDEMTGQDGRRLNLPLRVANAVDVWLRHTSPVGYPKKRSHEEYGRLTLRFRDHTQEPNQFHEVDLTPLLT